MAPHRGGVPEIAVEFECGGAAYRLRKAFRRGGRRARDAQAQRLQDDAAERPPAGAAALRAAAGAQPPGPRMPACRPCSGSTRRPRSAISRPSPAAASGSPRRSRPRSARVAGGERGPSSAGAWRASGRPLLHAGRQQETGALKAAGEQLRALEARADALDGRRREFDARVDRLARLRDERRRLIEQDQAARARERCEAARRRWPSSPSSSGVAALAIERLKAAAAEQAQGRGAASSAARCASAGGGRDPPGASSRLAVARAAERELDGAAPAAREQAEAARPRRAEARLAAEAERRRAIAHGACRLARRGELARLREPGPLPGRRGERQPRAGGACRAMRPRRSALARPGHATRTCQTAAARVAAAATRLDFKPRTAGRPAARARPSTRPAAAARPARPSSSWKASAGWS